MAEIQKSYPAPTWWEEALETSLTAESRQTGSFTSAPYGVDDFNFRIHVIKPGFSILGFEQGIYAQTNLTGREPKFDVYTRSMTDFVVSKIHAASITRPTITSDLPPEIAKHLPKDALVNLSAAVLFVPYESGIHTSKLAFQLLMPSLEDTINNLRNLKRR